MFNKTSIKKFISILLMLTLIVSTSSSVFAQETATKVVVDGIEYLISYSIDENNNTVTTVTSNNSNQYSQIVRDGDILYFSEINKSSRSISNNQIIDLNNLPEDKPVLESRASSSVQSTWWGYYAYYNDRPTGDSDTYWSLKHDKKGNINYYANYGTDLLSYSDSYYDDVVDIKGQQNGAIASIGFATAGTIAGAIAAATPASVAGVIAIVGSLLIGGGSAVGFFVAAWTSAQSANRNYDRIKALK